MIGQATSWYNTGSCTAFKPDWQAAGIQALLGGSTALLGFTSGFDYALNLTEGGSSSTAALNSGNLLNATTSGATQIIGTLSTQTSNDRC